MSTLYENIVTLCASRGIKCGKMCTDIGISKSLVTDLKMGRKSGMSATTAQKIADYFGVTVGYLLGTEEKKETLTEKDLSESEQKLIELFRKVPEDRQDFVMKMIEAAIESL